MIPFARSVEDFVLAIGTLHVEGGPLDTFFFFLDYCGSCICFRQNSSLQ